MAISVSRLIPRLLNAADTPARRLLLAQAAQNPTVFPTLMQEASRAVQNNSGQALKLANLAIETAEINKDFTGSAQAGRTAAQALRAQGRHEEAIAVLTVAGERATVAGDKRLAAQVQIGAIDSLGVLGRASEAFTLARKLETVLREQNAPADAAKVLTNAGTLHYRRDEYAQAVDCFAQALQILPPEDILATARVQANYASVLIETGDFEKGLVLFEQARQAFTEAELPHMVAMVDANTGWLRHTSGAYAAALAALTRAFRYFVESGQEIEAVKCEADRAEAYRELRLDAEALECYHRAAPALQRFGLAYEQGRALLGSASVLARMRRYDEAHRALESAETLFGAQRNRMQQANLHLVRAVLFRVQGETQNAEQAAQQAVKGFARRHAGYAAEARFLLAEAELTVLPAGEKAVRALTAIRRIAARTGRRWLVCRAERALGGYFLRQGQTKRALRHFRAGIAALEEARNLIAAEDLHIAFLQDKFAIYEDAIGTLLARGRPADLREALDYAERSRSRLLLERMQTAAQGIASADSDRISPALTALRAEISRAYYRMNALDEGTPRRLTGGNTTSPEDVTRLEYAYRTRLRESELLNFAGECGSARVREAFSRRGVQRVLLLDEMLIEYFVTGQTVSAFVLTRNSLRVVQNIAATPDILAAARRLRFQLQRIEMQSAHVCRYADQMQAAMDGVLQDLYALLLRPLEPFLKPKLVIVPHGPLHGLPFHAFHNGVQYAVESLEIVYAPSAAIFHAARISSRAAAPVQQTPLFALGCAEPNIARVMEEIEAIATLFPGASVFTGAAATLEAFRAHAPDCRIVHLAAHALFRADNPLFSGLQCADGWLMAHDLYGLKLNCELASLSACRTGASKVETGDELFGLIRGFLSAGAHSVAASLWAAEDATTAELMACFYRRIAQGESRAAALRAAQNEVRLHRPHPYYWAAFMLTGER